ncbi:MAG: phenylalanine--tRNA ligase subunit alpha [Clostridia bacterium]|nr:phenylalanine--tRNA ligase subunit alpha [Clostridia bacterium]
MENRIRELKAQIESEAAKIASLDELKEVRFKYLSKNGAIPALMKQLGSLSKEERPAAGKVINEFKVWATELFDESEKDLASKALLKRYEDEAIDVTMPSKTRKAGHLHPVTLVRNELIDAFTGMGFTVFEGPEIDDDFHNFTALNVSADHPARDKQDTFYINDDLLLRTHTSTGQIRALETMEPPFKIISPGRVFRCDDDGTHAPMFHQMEGLVIDKNLSLCDLQGLLDTLAKTVFDKNTKTRFRPSFFPFTEPSVEVDVTCCECHGAGCNLCKGTGWIEILGGGVVNRKVIENCGLDADVYSGLAFGTGLDRIAMLKYGVNNIHLLYDGDVRISDQFRK